MGLKEIFFNGPAAKINPPVLPTGNIINNKNDNIIQFAGAETGDLLANLLMLKTNDKNDFLSFMEAVSRLDPAQVKNPVSVVLQVTGAEPALLKASAQKYKEKLHEIGQAKISACQQSKADWDAKLTELDSQITALGTKKLHAVNEINKVIALNEIVRNDLNSLNEKLTELVKGLQ